MATKAWWQRPQWQLDRSERPATDVGTPWRFARMTAAGVVAIAAHTADGSMMAVTTAIVGRISRLAGRKSLEAPGPEARLG